MPVVHVRAAATDQADASSTLAVVAREVAAAVPCEIGGVWCTFQVLDAQTVGEEQRDREGRIAYVDVWIRGREDPAASGRALVAACRAVADGLHVPLEDVWGTLRPVEPGQVFAGGSLLEE